MIPRIVNGIPTELDVKALLGEFGVPEVGASLSYSDVSRVIKTPVTSSRWRTVTNQWRKRLIRDHRLFLLCRAGSFIVANEDEKSEYSGAKQKHGIRSIKVSATVDREYVDASQLSPTNQKAYEHRTLTNSTILQAAARLSKRQVPTLPQATKAAQS